ncbi:hypothetical protein BDR06DRAFT_1015033 [Suillus hirtellus]|nr:hypothetical protein BDR06DRAFT_1015033 [Suillus hirtellus]
MTYAAPEKTARGSKLVIKKFKTVKSDHIVLEDITRTTLIQKFLAIYESADQYSPGVHYGPGFKLSWTGSPGGKSGATTIENNHDFNVAISALMRKGGDTCAVSVDITFIPKQLIKIETRNFPMVPKRHVSIHSLKFSFNTPQGFPAFVPTYPVCFFASRWYRTSFFILFSISSRCTFDDCDAPTPYETPHTSTSSVPTPDTTSRAKNALSQMSPVPDNALEIHACLSDFLTRKGIDLLASETVLMNLELTPDIFPELPVARLCEILSAVKCCILKFQVFCKE